MSVHPFSCSRNPLQQQHTILLVEDEPFVRDATRSILEHAGYAVLPAEDAGEALKVHEHRERQIDLVMTDMVLPGRTGHQLGQELRQLSPELKVLVTSGYTNAEYAIEDPGAQMYFLAKPYSRRELIEKVERVLEIAPLRQAASQVG